LEIVSGIMVFFPGKERTPKNTPRSTKAAPISSTELNFSCVSHALAVTVTKGSSTNWYESVDAGQCFKMYRNRMKTAQDPMRIRKIKAIQVAVFAGRNCGSFQIRLIL